MEKKNIVSLFVALVLATTFVAAGQVTPYNDGTYSVTQYGSVTDALQRQMCNNIKLWNPTDPSAWCSTSDTYTTYCVVSGFNEEGVYRYEKNVCAHTTARSRSATTFIARHTVERKDSVQLYSEVHIQRNNALGEPYPVYWIKDTTRIV